MQEQRPFGQQCPSPLNTPYYHDSIKYIFSVSLQSVINMTAHLHLKSCNYNQCKTLKSCQPQSLPIAKRKTKSTARSQHLTQLQWQRHSSTQTTTKKKSEFLPKRCIPPKPFQFLILLCCKLRLWPQLICFYPLEISTATRTVFAQRHLQHQTSFSKILLPLV